MFLLDIPSQKILCPTLIALDLNCAQVAFVQHKGCVGPWGWVHDLGRKWYVWSLTLKDENIYTPTEISTSFSSVFCYIYWGRLVVKFIYILCGEVPASSTPIPHLTSYYVTTCLQTSTICSTSHSLGVWPLCVSSRPSIVRSSWHLQSGKEPLITCH